MATNQAFNYGNSLANFNFLSISSLMDWKPDLDELLSIHGIRDENGLMLKPGLVWVEFSIQSLHSLP